LIPCAKRLLLVLLAVTTLTGASLPARPETTDHNRARGAERVSRAAQQHSRIIFGGSCDDDIWTTLGVPSLPFFPSTSRVAIWTGGKVIVWGTSGQFSGGYIFDLSMGGSNQMNPTGQPTPQNWFTAVWTGRIMIVWGGTVSGADVTTSGGLYNPANDSWSPMTTAGSPQSAGKYAAVWTGSDMIVYGSGGGARYDPSADAWTPVNLNFAPQFSLNKPVSAVWTGSEAIFWGSQLVSSTKTYAQLGGRYNEGTDTWKPVSTTGAPLGTDGVQTVWTGSQMIVWTNDGDSGIWDLGTDSWTPLPAMNLPERQNLTTAEAAVWTGNELLVWGQTDSNIGARYDPATRIWRAVSELNAPPAGSYVGTWAGNQLFVLGPSRDTPPGMVPAIFGSLYCANAPTGCTFMLGSSSQTFGSGGGNGEVSITASTATCQWSATTDSSWITLQNSGGTGNGTLNFGVAANSGTGSRTGHISVFGENFTVTQAGGPTVTGVSAQGKNAIVTGANFDPGAIVLVNSAPAKRTLRDPLNPNMLIGKKGLKGIASGRTVAVQVQNSDGAISDPFAFVRP
ncbi:MAG: BACON domain-containing protein, partial [Blastocatellia bacterium]